MKQKITRDHSGVCRIKEDNREQVPTHNEHKLKYVYTHSIEAECFPELWSHKTTFRQVCEKVYAGHESLK